MKITLITPAMMKYQLSYDSFISSLDKINDLLPYKIIKSDDELFIQIEDKKLSFTIFGNGIIVFNYCFEEVGNESFNYYLNKKDLYTSQFIDQKGKFVDTLKIIDQYFSKMDFKENYFFNGKYVSYSLATYPPHI